MKKRKICGKEILPMGFGCWAIGGPWTIMGKQAGWGDIDDNTSIAALRRAYDKGIQFFDTAANYGCGHSERILGKALKAVRNDVLLATKFGYNINEEAKTVDFYESKVDSTLIAIKLKEDCERSLSRLGTDYIDLYQLHVNGYPEELMGPVIYKLEELIQEGKIRYYGWSTDGYDKVDHIAQQKNCAGIQHKINFAQDAPEMIELCEKYNIASINRSPLGMGVLTGKYSAQSKFAENDTRSGKNFQKVMHELILPSLDDLKTKLTTDGRSMAQGALGWLWSRSPNTIPIPGMRNVAQVDENTKAFDYGPLL